MLKVNIRLRKRRLFFSSSCKSQLFLGACLGPSWRLCGGQAGAAWYTELGGDKPTPPHAMHKYVIMLIQPATNDIHMVTFPYRNKPKHLHSDPCKLLVFTRLPFISIINYSSLHIPPCLDAAPFERGKITPHRPLYSCLQNSGAVFSVLSRVINQYYWTPGLWHTHHASDFFCNQVFYYSDLLNYAFRKTI